MDNISTLIRNVNFLILFIRGNNKRKKGARAHQRDTPSTFLVKPLLIFGYYLRDRLT